MLPFFLEGVYPKRVIKLDDVKGGDMVEFLGNGQQFVAYGTHPEGERYVWDWRGCPTYPSLTGDEFEAWWREYFERFGAVQLGGTSGTRKALVAGAKVVTTDPVALYLMEKDIYLGEGKDGTLNIVCPWSDNHSMTSGDTETVYMPPGGRGYGQGHFKCLHGGCAGKTDSDFLEAVGYNDTFFEDLGPQPEAEQSKLATKGAFFDIGNDWHAIAKRMIFDKWSLGVKPTLRYAQQNWYKYDGRKYVPQEADSVTAEVSNYLNLAWKYDKTAEDFVPFLPTRNKVNEALHALQVKTLIPCAVAPMWIGGDGRALDYVAVADGLLHLPTRTLQPHTPDFFNTTALPFAWKGSEGEPTAWLTFLDTLWPDDTETKATLQTIFGYLLTNDTSQQKMFLIKGPPRSGKGTIARVLGALLGDENTVSTSFAQLAQVPFGLESLLGKSLAFLPEARNTGGKHASIQVAVERILSITGEDNVSVERKGHKAWQGKLPTRFFMMANEVPALGDSTEAFASRFIAIATTRSFLGSEDKGLTDRLLGELPQIMRWGLDGYKLLNEQGRFIAPIGSEELMEDIADANNPVRLFVKECYQLDPKGAVGKTEMFEKYRSWCEKANVHATGQRHFGSSLFSAYPQISAGERGRREKRETVYVGVRVKNSEFDNLGV